MKKTLFIITLVVLVFALAACNAAGQKDAVVGSVNGVDIYQSEYEHYLSDYFDSYYTYYGDNYGIWYSVVNAMTKDNYKSLLSDAEKRYGIE